MILENKCTHFMNLIANIFLQAQLFDIKLSRNTIFFFSRYLVITVVFFL